MNDSFRAFSIKGKTLDVGGGRKPDYFSHLMNDGTAEVMPIDGSMTGIDFETDALPFDDATFDTLICANLLEHIYNYQFLLLQMRRVLRPGGHLIGFVPFWMAYHPDPHDYFRYTQEALERMLADAGFSDISVRPLPGGPFSANFNTIVLSLPRVLRPFAYLGYAFLDRVFIAVRPHATNRNPLGYTFYTTNA